MLTRFPGQVATIQTLARPTGSAEQRSALHVVLDTPMGRLRAVSTQLSSSPMASAARMQQLAAIAKELVAKRRDDETVLVAGDLNAEPDSDEVRGFCGHKTPSLVEGHLVLDLWRFADPASPADTWDRANPFVAATREPSSRIDYLMMSPGPDGRLPLVHGIERFAAVPEGGAWASDHAGVIAEVER